MIPIAFCFSLSLPPSLPEIKNKSSRFYSIHQLRWHSQYHQKVNTTLQPRLSVIHGWIAAKSTQISMLILNKYRRKSFSYLPSLFVSTHTLQSLLLFYTPPAALIQFLIFSIISSRSRLFNIKWRTVQARPWNQHNTEWMVFHFLLHRLSVHRRGRGWMMSIELHAESARTTITTYVHHHLWMAALVSSRAEFISRFIHRHAGRL